MSEVKVWNGSLVTDLDDFWIKVIVIVRGNSGLKVNKSTNSIFLL